MSDPAQPESDRERLIRYHDALTRITNLGGDRAAAVRSAQELREIAETALRPESASLMQRQSCSDT